MIKIRKHICTNLLHLHKHKIATHTLKPFQMQHQNDRVSIDMRSREKKNEKKKVSANLFSFFFRLYCIVYQNQWHKLYSTSWYNLLLISAKTKMKRNRIIMIPIANHQYPISNIIIYTESWHTLVHRGVSVFGHWPLQNYDFLRKY